MLLAITTPTIPIWDQPGRVTSIPVPRDSSPSSAGSALTPQRNIASIMAEPTPSFIPMKSSALSASSMASYEKSICEKSGFESSSCKSCCWVKINILIPLSKIYCVIRTVFPKQLL